MAQTLPNSSAFFRGQLDAINGVRPPRQPSASAAYNDHLYYRGYMQQIKKMQQSNELRFAALS